jgi:hypothetical protein
MRTRPTLLLAGIALAALWSCQDPIDLTLPDGQTRLIVNGSVSDNQPVYADLSWSVNYLSEDPNPAVENATVVLFENGLPVDTLVHVLDGHYEGDFIGSYAQSYHVSVTLPETGDLPFGTWQSSPEAMGRCNPFDSIYSAFVPRAPFVREGYYVYAHWTELAGIGDHYRARLWRNDTLENAPFNIQVFDDGFLDGRSNNDIDLPAIEVAGPDAIGVTYTIEIASIPMGLYSYLQLLREQTLQVGGLFDPPPAPIIGNIFREGDPEDFAIGYFYASARRQSSITITP